MMERVRPAQLTTTVVPESDAFERVAASRDAWLEGDVAAADIETAGWTVHEWLSFLNNLPDELSRNQLDELDGAFELTRSRNNEIAHSWLLIAIRNGYEPANERLEQYLIGIGRRKLIRPLYEELVKSADGKQFARRVYAQARPGYHPLAQRTVDAIISGDSR